MVVTGPGLSGGTVYTIGAVLDTQQFTITQSVPNGSFLGWSANTQTTNVVTLNNPADFTQNLNDINNFQVGQLVTGDGIPPYAFITAMKSVATPYGTVWQLILSGSIAQTFAVSGTFAQTASLLPVSKYFLATGGAGTLTLTAGTADAIVGMRVGQVISGTGIPSNTYITAISGTQITLSNPVTGPVTAGTFGEVAPSALTKMGSGTTNLLADISVMGTMPVSVNAGVLKISNSGSLASTAIFASTPGSLTVQPGGALVLDNTNMNLSRLGGRAVTLGGSLTLSGSAGAASWENLVGGLNLAPGNSVITLLSGGSEANVLVGSLAAAPGASVLIRGTNLGAGSMSAGTATFLSTSAVTFTGGTGATGTVTKGILPWALIDSSSLGFGTSFAFATVDSTASITGTPGAMLRGLAISEGTGAANAFYSDINLVMSDWWSFWATARLIPLI